MKYFLSIPFFLVFMALASCSSDSKRIVDLNLRYVTASSAPAQSDPQAQAQIAEAASSINNSLENLSAMEQALHPRIKMQQPANPRMIGMARIASISWAGPVTPVIVQIAKASGYRLHILGNPPATPILVTVDAENQPLATILRNISYQVASTASIHVYPRRRILELRFLSR